jgi:putative restriction endonuclease
MRFWLGVTDNQWFNFVSSHQCPEVNFWQPSARAPFVSLPEGTPFLFKLKRPNHHVAGGGHFVRHTRLPLSTAWDVFGQQNGADSLQEFVRLISGNRVEPATLETEIGCTVVTDVFYLPKQRWVSVEGRFERNIVVGRTADTMVRTEDLALWNELQLAHGSLAVQEQVPEHARYGREFLAKSRLGQGSFRTLVIDAYGRRCAITGENTLPVLEAAHIQPYGESGPHQVSNGLLLRSDFHKLFDAGLVTVEPDYRVRVSGKIRDRYFNGKAYYRMDGQQLASLPEISCDQPDPGFLSWHNNHRFVA